MVAFVIYSVLMTLLIASSYLIFWLLEQPYVAFNRDGALVFVSLGAFLNLALGSFDIDSGDNGTIVIVLGVWLLLVGYAVKAIYDAARDSIADTMKTYLERWGV